MVGATALPPIVGDLQKAGILDFLKDVLPADGRKMIALQDDRVAIVVASNKQNGQAVIGDPGKERVTQVVRRKQNQQDVYYELERGRMSVQPVRFRGWVEAVITQVE